MGTTDNRFQVGCSYCGYLQGFYKFQEAVMYASLIAFRHNEPNENVEIYDIMAHIGSPELYSANGDVIRVRMFRRTDDEMPRV